VVAVGSIHSIVVVADTVYVTHWSKLIMDAVMHVYTVYCQLR